MRIKRKDYQNLFKLWSRFTLEEKNNWKTKENFFEWCLLKQQYNENLSIRKIKRKKNYSKNNLTFGIYINHNFFPLSFFTDNGLQYNNLTGYFSLHFPTSTNKENNNIIINGKAEKEIKYNILKFLNSKKKHLIISQELYDNFFAKIQNKT